MLKPIDDNTIYQVYRDSPNSEDANVQFSGDIVFYGDNNEKYLSSSSLYRFGAESPFQSHDSSVSEVISDEDEWLKGIQDKMYVGSKLSFCFFVRLMQELIAPLLLVLQG